MEALFIQLDKAKGRATSSLGKGELGDVLKAFFRVGQPGGKSEERHDELMQVCFSILPGPGLITFGVNELFKCMYAFIFDIEYQILLNNEPVTSRLKRALCSHVGF